MKFLFYLIVLLLTYSCYYNVDLNDYASRKHDRYGNEIPYDEYYWYYNRELFDGVDSCFVVGTMETEFDCTYEFNVNHRCYVYNDTICIIKKHIAKDRNVFNGVIYIKDREPFRLIQKLN